MAGSSGSSKTFSFRGGPEPPYESLLHVDGSTRNTGIRTDQPEYGLDVNGTTRVRDILDVVGNLSIAPPSTLSFGEQYRQIVNLYSTNYGLGVQTDTTYLRTGGNFAFFTGGSHDDSTYSSGPGGAVFMVMDGNTKHIGMGTVSPNEPLHVAGNVRSGGSFKPAAEGGVYWDMHGNGVRNVKADSTFGRGTVATYGGDGQGGYEGYSIEGRYVFMADSDNTWGIFNDIDDHWMIQGDRNSVRLKYDGGTKLTTESGGVRVYGNAVMDGGDLVGNASTATRLQTARDINNVSFDGTGGITVNGLLYDVNDGWLRSLNDDGHVRLYGNSRSMVFRTDGKSGYSSLGGYPFVWAYGGNNSGNRRMLLSDDGKLWVSNYGWLHDKFYHSGDSPSFNVVNASDSIRFGGSDRGITDSRGSYGTISTRGNGKGGWEGFSIDGRYVFMGRNDDCGIYNDIDNEWFVYCTRNGNVELKHNGNSKIETTNDGGKVNGNLNVSGTLRSGGVVVGAQVSRLRSSQSTSTTTVTLDTDDNRSFATSFSNNEGPRGHDGSRGPRGNTGSRGPRGYTGSRGPRGPQGEGLSGEARLDHMRVDRSIYLPSGSGWIGYSKSDQSKPNIEFEDSGMELTGGPVHIGEDANRGGSNGELYVGTNTHSKRYYVDGSDVHIGRYYNFLGFRNNDNDTTVAYVSSTGYYYDINFTGQHRCVLRGHTREEAEGLQGLIVTANQSSYTNMNPLVTGIRSITINDALPIVTLCRTAYDVNVFGVISSTEDRATRTHGSGAFVSNIGKEEGDERIFVNSLGEGAMWVCDVGASPIRSGSYITSSSVPGYGMAQDGAVLHNHTVAKITMDCDFEPASEARQRIKTKTVREDVTKVAQEDKEIVLTKKKVVFDESLKKYVKKEVKTSRTQKVNVQEEVDVYDETGETVVGKHMVDKTVTETVTKVVNVLDDAGVVQWEDELDDSGQAIMDPRYAVRFLTSQGTIISEAEYRDRKSSGAEDVYRAAFVGCSYHCG